MTLHVSIHRHFGSSFEFAQTTLELLDSDFVDATDMLFKQSPMLGHVTTLSTFVTRFGRSRSFFSMNIFDMNIHVLFSGTFVVAIRTIKRFETFVNRVLVGNEISAIRKTFVAFLASPGP